MEHLRAKIRVLVTHQIQFIEKATKILVLKDGQCLAYGTFQELQSMEIDFMSLLKKPKSHKEEDEEESLADKSDVEKHDRSRTDPASKVESTQQESSEAKPEQKIEEEQIQRGALKSRVYFEYIQSGGGPIIWTSMIALTLISQTVFHGSDIFLTSWTNKNQESVPSESERNRDIYIFTGIIVVLFFSTIARALNLFAICMNASVRLHNKIFARLLRVPISFFDTNPSGRILNRFTKDLALIDESLPRSAFDLNLTIAQAIGTVITVSIVNWYLVLPALALAVVIVAIRSVYIKTSRDIKRYDGLGMCLMDFNTF